MTEYLTSETVEEVSTCEILEYPLPHKPQMNVRVKQLPVATMRRLGKLLQKGGESAEAAQREMITKSVVNPDGSPVFTDANVAVLRDGNTALYASLVAVIGKANTRTDDDDSLVDSLEKNSGTTA